MKVVTVCGMGFGTSLMLLMSVKESGRKYGITVEGEATDLGSYKGKSCDLIVASSEIAKQIEADVPVLAITNLLDKAEVEEKAVPEGSTWIEKYAEGLAIGLITSFAAMLLLLLILLIRRRQKKKTGNIAGSERK